MADQKDSVLDKAESLARQILDRLGSKVDAKLASGADQPLKPHIIGDLASRIERLIESSLEQDQHGVRKIAPNYFKVLFTYEETSALSPQYIEAVSKEMTTTIFEYINNRRYVTRGPIRVEIGRDVFGKSTAVKASFLSDEDQSENAPQPGSEPTAETSKIVCFSSMDGRRYRVELNPESAPAYIGRTAGNAIRIDDPSVSRLHCSVCLRSGGRVVIADLGSINGTCVNERLLGRDEAQVLKAGDIIGVGDFKLTITEIA